MDAQIARQLKLGDERLNEALLSFAKNAMTRYEPRVISEKANAGELKGTVHDVEHTLYFQPDGYRFLVPVDLSQCRERAVLMDGHRFQVHGKLLAKDGRPDHLVVFSAKPDPE
tara:strand:+ start:69 stop:407 length:339 start_codon:yes stop_codon:yes gene_type:complete